MSRIWRALRRCSPRATSGVVSFSSSTFDKVDRHGICMADHAAHNRVCANYRVGLHDHPLSLPDGFDSLIKSFGLHLVVPWYSADSPVVLNSGPGATRMAINLAPPCLASFTSCSTPELRPRPGTGRPKRASNLLYETTPKSTAPDRNLRLKAILKSKNVCNGY
jgi:hypothetical protein